MRPNSIAVDEGEQKTKVPQEAHHHEKDQLDAGALFVLKSKGSWVHCGYHLTTSIVAPPLLSLPYAFTFLGWAPGIVCLVIGALVSFYSYNLLSLVLEHHAHLGHRHLRFRDMANDILDECLILPDVPRDSTKSWPPRWNPPSEDLPDNPVQDSQNPVPDDFFQDSQDPMALDSQATFWPCWICGASDSDDEVHAACNLSSP